MVCILPVAYEVECKEKGTQNVEKLSFGTVFLLLILQCKGILIL